MIRVKEKAWAGLKTWIKAKIKVQKTIKREVWVLLPLVRASASLFLLVGEKLW